MKAKENWSYVIENTEFCDSLGRTMNLNRDYKGIKKYQTPYARIMNDISSTYYWKRVQHHWENLIKQEHYIPLQTKLEVSNCALEDTIQFNKTGLLEKMIKAYVIR